MSDLTIEYAAENPEFSDNLALKYGFDPSVRVWSDDEHVRKEIERLLAVSRIDEQTGIKSLAGLDLSDEAPFDLSTAIFEDVDMQDLRLPKQTNLSNAKLHACNLLDVNLEECITE